MSRVFFEIPPDKDKKNNNDKTQQRLNNRRVALANAASNIVDNSDLRQYNHKIFQYQNRFYPEYLNQKNKIEHIIPIAKKFCFGFGLDIGGTDDLHFPEANVLNFSEYSAFNLPSGNYDYIFSSHFLEYVDDYVRALCVWRDSLRPGGQIFLYLSHPDAMHWRPENNITRLHSFRPEKIAFLLKQLGFVQIFYSNRDLFWSFSVTGAKSYDYNDDDCCYRK